MLKIPALLQSSPKFRQILLFGLLLILLLLIVPWLYLQSNQEHVLHRQGAQALQEGRHQEAVQFLQASRQAGKDTIRLLEKLAEACLALEEFEQAKDIFTELSRRKPEDKQLQLQLAKVKALSGTEDQALQLLDSLLAQKPGWRTARIYKARILTWNDRFQEAIDIYYQILKEPE